MPFERFFRKPTDKKPNETSADDEDSSLDADPWFSQDETAPKTPATVLERLREALRRNPIIAVGFTAASLVVTACSSDLFQQKPGIEPEKSGESIAEKTYPTVVDQIEISEENNEIVMVLGKEHSIRITDWAHREQWDQNLVPETGNPTFAWHRDVLEQQYADSFNFNTPVIGIDPMFMRAGEYPSFATSYGNMEIGNEAVVIPAFVNLWLKTANIELGKKFDEESDLSDLTAAEWMYVLQAPTKLISYDKQLASIFPEYNKTLTESHWRKSIDELISDGIGVCRDNERLMITSYVIANQLFDLADNGLLYLPMVNVIDAKHTRGAFYLSINPVDMVVVGVDTTYGEGNIQSSLSAASQADTAVWHSQQYGKDLELTPWAQIAGLELFQEYSDATDMEISPVAQAILRREKRQAQIDAYQAENHAGKKKQLLEDIYNDLFSEITTDSLVGEFPLNIPSRLVHMYDQLISIAKERDRLNGKDRGYEAIATTEFADYLTRNGIDAEKVRALTHQIDRLPQDERVQRLRKIQEMLEKSSNL